MTFQKKEEPLPIRGRRHHPERSSTLMDIHMEMPIKSKVSKLDGLYIQSEPAASRALRRWSNNPSAEGLIINDP